MQVCSVVAYTCIERECVMRKSIYCLLAVFILPAVFVSAESDSGKFLPHPAPVTVTNIFLEATGGAAFPLTFFAKDSKPMTNSGGVATFGAGYNWDGWLMGIEAGMDRWGEGTGPGALMNNFGNNILLFKLQRVISHNTVSKFPSWFELIPRASLGVNFITTDYYPSGRAKRDGREEHVNLFDDYANCLFYRFSLESSFYLGTDMFIPYAGVDYNAFYDKSIGGGFGGFATAFVGIRTYPFGAVNDIKRRNREKKVKLAAEQEAAHEAEVALWAQSECAITANPDADFTPDGDGINDISILTPSVARLEDNPESWKIEILDPQNNMFRTWTGTGSLPANLPWDEKSDSGEIAFSRDTYTAKLTVTPDKKDRARTGQNSLEYSAIIRTGILMHVVKPNESWKIVVNTIFFDPDKPTFDKITEAQKEANRNTLDSVASQIRAHGDVKVTVEGYANNVSNTEKENSEELIPLSQARAEAIMQQLVDRGLEANNLSAKGYGGANPIAAWEDHANWWKNRRVEFLVTK